MTIPTITVLPVAPARTDTPAVFNTRADAFLGALYSPFSTQMNTTIGSMNTDIAGVNADAIAAAASAVDAAASATAAESSAGAVEWVSGTTYAVGYAVWSPIDFQSYRAKVITSGTVDPSAAPSVWEPIGGAGGLSYILKTANFTASKNEGILANTSGGAFTVTLPATPTTGDEVVIADAGGAFGTNNCIADRNGSTIEGDSANLNLNINGVSVQFVYSGTTWEVYAQVGGNGGDVVTLTGTQTLTNKTLTSPVLGGITTTASGNLVVDPATQIVEVKGDGSSVEGQIKLNCHDNSHGQTVKAQPHSASVTNTMLLPVGTSSTLVSLVSTDTLTNKTMVDTVYALSGLALLATNGGVQTKTVGSAIAFTDSLVSGDAIVLMLEAGASYTVTWPTMTWVTSAGNVAPTLTAKDTIVLWKVGSVLYGAYTGSYV